MQKSDPINSKPLNWRFPAFLLLFAICAILTIPALGFERGLIAAFDAAAAIFLLSFAWLFVHGVQDIRSAAAANDASRLLRLVVALLLTLVVLATMTAQIAGPRNLAPLDKALFAGTIVVVWLFANTMYALHYAHVYYSPGADGTDQGGLQFPGDSEPLMPDFVYFAFTIGVAVQTADVAVSSPGIRGVVTVHAILAFFFNIGVLALTINMVGTG